MRPKAPPPVCSLSKATLDQLMEHSTKRLQLEARLQRPIETWAEFNEAHRALLQVAGWAITLQCKLDNAARGLLESAAGRTRKRPELTELDAALVRSLAPRLGLTEHQVLSRALAALAATIEPGNAAA